MLQERVRKSADRYSSLKCENALKYRDRDVML